MAAEDEQEPDYRFTLANERTFLAWMRTALALLAAGVAVVQLVPQFSVAGVRTAVGVTLGAMSVLVSLGGVWRWRGRAGGDASRPAVAADEAYLGAGGCAGAACGRGRHPAA